MRTCINHPEGKETELYSNVLGEMKMLPFSQKNWHDRETSPIRGRTIGGNSASDWILDVNSSHAKLGFQISQSEHLSPLFTNYLSLPLSAGTNFSPVFSSGTATCTLPVQPLSFSQRPVADSKRPSGSPSMPSEQSNS